MASNRLLVTTDFSDVSFAALTYAANLKDYQITLLSVLQTGDVPPDLLKQMPDPSAIQEYRKSVAVQTKEKLDTIANQYFSGSDVNTDVVVSDADAAAEICTYAKDNAIDMIVITSQGRDALGSLFVGSTVQKVLRMTQIPVLVIPKTTG